MARVTVLCLLALLSVATATVYFEERFNDGDAWTKRWVESDWKKDEGTAGEWKLSSGTHFKDESDKGLKTHPDARFFALSSKIKTMDNSDKVLVLQFQVKHEQTLDCGGGYIKLLEGDVDQKKFNGDTPYSIMFGPDICGWSTKRIHAIITHEGKNMLIKKDLECATDELSHVYTFILSPNNTYRILMDNEEKASGSIFEDWDFLKPETIPDPEEKKPEDWVDEEYMDDPTDKKPAGWDDIPAEIVDPEAEKPEDWSDEEDGEWEAPLVPNPDFKGEWSPKRIKNPAYKGVWKAKMIPNPEFVSKPFAYKLPPLNYVGIEIWQVKAGSIFDNILVTDDADYARQVAEETWGALKDVEKEKYDAEEAARAKRIEEQKKKTDEEKAARGEDGEDGEDGEEGDDDLEDDGGDLGDDEALTEEDILEGGDDEQGHDEL